MANILVNPYVIREVGTKISILPTQLDFNLYKNLKNNLISKVEGKNIKLGNVIRVHRISDYSNGYIDTNNFSGTAIYDIKYIATLCILIDQKQIIVKVNMQSEENKGINIKELKAIRCENGCIDCIIMTNLIDMQKFQINVDGTISYKETGNPIMHNDYLKVTIQNKQINAGANRIMILGYLNDIATAKEVEASFNPPSDETMQVKSGIDINEEEIIQVFE